MAKSPINLLQELLIKQGYFPVYDDVGVKKSGILNQFVCKVKCKQFCAEGVGSNKKEAKQNAAENMLLLLEKCNEIPVCKVSPVAKVENVQISRPTKICESTSPSKIEDQSRPDHINYVGRLQELCLQQQLSVKDVLYEVVEESGPAHMRTFTVKVSMGSFHARGTAQCKKIAKQKAAKNLLQLGCPDMIINMEKYNKSNLKQFKKEELENSIKKLGIDISECVFSKPKLPVVEMSKRAKTLYITNTDKKHRVTRRDILLKDVHNSFEETYSSKISYNIRQKMKTVRDTYTNNADIVQEVLQDIVKALEIKIEKCILPSLSKEIYMVSLRLLSHPIITQCGVGKTKYKAEINAMYNIIVTISTLLNIS